MCHHVDQVTESRIPVGDLRFRPSIYGIIIENGKILLVPQLGDGYDFPGGGVDEGEMLDEALSREVKEETGLDVDPDMTKPLHVASDFFYHDYQDQAYHSILLFYLCTNPRGEISTDGFDFYEKKYAQKAEWIDIDIAINAKFYNPVDSARIIEDAVCL